MCYTNKFDFDFKFYPWTAPWSELLIACTREIQLKLRTVSTFWHQARNQPSQLEKIQDVTPHTLSAEVVIDQAIRTDKMKRFCQSWPPVRPESCMKDVKKNQKHDASLHQVARYWTLRVSVFGRGEKSPNIVWSNYDEAQITPFDYFEDEVSIHHSWWLFHILFFFLLCHNVSVGFLCDALSPGPCLAAQRPDGFSCAFDESVMQIKWRLGTTGKSKQHDVSQQN